MYKTTFKNQQRRADFIAPAEIPSFLEEDRDHETRRADILKAIASLEAKRREMKLVRDLGASLEQRQEQTRLYKELGKSKLALQAELTALGPVKLKADLGELIVHELRKIVGPEVYVAAVNRARSQFLAGKTKNEINAEREAANGI